MLRNYVEAMDIHLCFVDVSSCNLITYIQIFMVEREFINKERLYRSLPRAVASEMKKKTVYVTIQSVSKEE